MDMAKTLSYYYQVDLVSCDSLATDLKRYAALIIAKPTKDFSERDKYVIDQYLMHGGRLLWCLDEVDVYHEVLKNSGDCTCCLSAFECGRYVVPLWGKDKS